MDTIKLLIDEAAGIYIPKNFYTNFNFRLWGLSKEAFRDLSNTENQLYWDAWDEALAQAKYLDDDGHTWTLYQDGSLFAVRDDHSWDVE